MHNARSNRTLERRGVGELISTSPSLGIKCPSSTSLDFIVPSALILKTQAEGITMAFGGRFDLSITSAAFLSIMDLNSFNRDCRHFSCTDLGNFSKCDNDRGWVASQMLSVAEVSSSKCANDITALRLRSYKGRHRRELRSSSARSPSSYETSVPCPLGS